MVPLLMLSPDLLYPKYLLCHGLTHALNFWYRSWSTL